MRAMFWYIKANLENSYAMQSSRVAAFLPDAVMPNGKRFFDNVKGQLDRFQALPEPQKEKPREIKVINPTHDEPIIIDENDEGWKETQ